MNPSADLAAARRTPGASARLVRTRSLRPASPQVEPPKPASARLPVPVSEPVLPAPIPDSCRPTAQGLSILGISLLLISTPFWQEHTVGHYGGLVLLVAFGMSWFFARFQVRFAKAQWIPSTSCHAGALVSVGARLSAEKNLNTITLVAPDPAHGNEPFTVCNVPNLTAGQIGAAWNVRFPQRGAVELPPLMVESAFPFGLWKARKKAGKGASILVYPALGIASEQLERMIDHWREEGRSIARSGLEEVSHLRPYRLGDSPRLIHWHASARQGDLVVRHLLESERDRIEILLDLRTKNQHSRRLERLLSAVATIIDRLLERGWMVSLHGATTALQPIDGNRPALMGALALTQAHKPGPFIAPPALMARHGFWLVCTLDDTLTLDEPNCRLVRLTDLDTWIQPGRPT